ncbi:hypothetical protein [Sphingomonas sp. M1-B02]|uniref:hypothetical protein n=1 Tax=Sphingomonas sp. M1-B02 TaxID=3114300 RepID=UPI0022403C18|nr:hypothetical protein [Sphingomonas sp. S6-11]UZK65941.1 hypothetical protein OKW87_15755 [Sphingomonas sp. S6-11]
MADDIRDAAAADADKQRITADELLEQLAQTTSESAGGNVSGTAADSDFDIVFEPEKQPKDGN